MDKHTKIVLAIALSNIFIMFLGIGLIIPVLPTLMNTLNISGRTVGYLTAAFAIAQLATSPVSGRFTDKYGRKVMIIFGLMIFAISEFLFAIGNVIEVLFLSRILGGISGAFIMPAVTAYIADITTIETRSKALGYMSAVINTGFIIGPGIGGFLAEVGTRVPFYSAAFLGMLATILSLIFLKEPERKEQPEIVEKQESKPGLKMIFAPIFFIAFLIIFISSFGLAVMDSFYSLYTDHKFQFTPSDIAIAITAASIVGVIFQLLLFERMTKWIGEINLIRICLVISTTFVLVMTQVSSFTMVIVATSFMFTGFDIIRPAVTAYLSKIAGNHQGFAGGMNSMFTSLANALGPILGGIFFDMDIDYPYYASAVFLVIAFILALMWKKPSQLT